MMKVVLSVLMIIVMCALGVDVEPAFGAKLGWQVMSAGGVQGSGTSHVLDGTTCQTATGKGTGNLHGVNHGFWQSWYVTGDADGSGGIDIDDVVYLITYIFSAGPPPMPLAAGDADCSGGVDIDDAVYLITYIFSGGHAPGDPDGDGSPDC
jgi:hypothetical protein